MVRKSIAWLIPTVAIAVLGATNRAQAQTTKNFDIEYKTQITAIAPAADSHYSTWAAQPSMVPTRQHPSIPEDLELLQALLVLSAYEYIQKGDFVKMKFRANQALALALQKGLHCNIDNDELSEARRRAWWMTVTSL